MHQVTRPFTSYNTTAMSDESRHLMRCDEISRVGTGIVAVGYYEEVTHVLQRARLA